MAQRKDEGALVPAGGPGQGANVVERNVNAVGAALTASAMSEVRLAMQLAQEFPRNEDHCRGRILKACRHPLFADKATWRYPRSGKQLEGPSIVLAQEMAKMWQHFRYGAEVVEDQGPRRTVRCWAWDLENNTKKVLDVTFEKLIYRKFKQGEKDVGRWIEPDERDLLELTNRQASKGARNCILGLMPWDLVQEAMQVCKETRATEDAKDPDLQRKRIISSFSGIGVNGAELTAYLGYPLEQMPPKDVERLRGIYVGIKEEETTWQEVVGKQAAEEGVGDEKHRSAIAMRKAVRERAERARGQAAEKPEGGGA